ncbi:CHAT domain-containing protein [Dactylosporangium salmoneum]|uniref:CHAT domain-containing protein n=1 Tax=Dactylosporangium salmoneum TaxID=53361 RepID=A0ABP5SNV0_9ACTN
MILPRIVIDVRPDGPDWIVSVGCATPPLEHRMPALELPGGRRLPAPAGADPAKVASMLERIDDNTTDAADVREYGCLLYEALLAPAWPAIQMRPDVVEARGVELALQWPASETALHSMLWEAMYDGNHPLAGHPRLLVAVTRLVPTDVAERPYELQRPARMLLACGAPLTDAIIRPGAMFVGLVRALETTGMCSPRVDLHVTAQHLADACREFRPDLVHLIAHGAAGGESGVVSLGSGRPGGGDVDGAQLLAALTDGGRPAAVILSACRSGSINPRTGALPLAAQLVGGGIPVVVAMTGDIAETACRLYTNKMLEALREGEPLVAAAARGRRAALIGEMSSLHRLDWAMPALFLARNVEPGARLIDPEQAHRLGDIARELELLMQPVFIGRNAFLSQIDAAFPPERRPGTGLVIVGRDGPIASLGGTRLLREIGHRLLRRGHLPILLGPFSQMAPTTLLQVICQITTKMAQFAEQTEVRLPASRLLGLRGTTDWPMPAAEDEIEAYYTASYELSQRDPSAVVPDRTRSRLRSDLYALALAAADAGPPFGAHTTPVLLLDELHRWEGVVRQLLGLVRPSGLGTARLPIPVIATASLSAGDGEAVRQFISPRKNQPGYLYEELRALGSAEAALGFQWVLMRPWGEHPAYVAPTSTDHAMLAKTLLRLSGQPKAVNGDLYLLAGALSDLGLLEQVDDDKVYADFAERYA